MKILYDLANILIDQKGKENINKQRGTQIVILERPVVVDLYDFIIKGAFDCIKIGQTKEWILNNFPDPDDVENGFHMTKKGSIWTYGNIEFHFSDNILFLIFCDNFSTFDEGCDAKSWVDNI